MYGNAILIIKPVGCNKMFSLSENIHNLHDIITKMTFHGSFTYSTATSIYSWLKSYGLFVKPFSVSSLRATQRSCIRLVQKYYIPINYLVGRWVGNTPSALNENKSCLEPTRRQFLTYQTRIVCITYYNNSLA